MTRCGRSRRRRGSGASGNGSVRGPLAGDRLPPRPLPGRRAHVRVDDGSLGRLGRAAGAARLRRSLPGDSAKFWLLRGHVGAGALAPPASASLGLVFVAPWITSALAGSTWCWPGACSVRAPTPSRRRRWRGSRRAARRPSTAPRPSGAASSATSTTAPSSASSRWPPTSARRGAARHRPRGRARAGGRRPRGGQGRPQGDPRPGARHPPGDPRGPRPRRRAVRGRRPLAGAGRPSTSTWPPGRRGRRERGLLRRHRGAHQRGPPRQATQASVSIARAGDRLVVEVRDDGAAAAPTPPRHRACRACATGSPGSAGRCT